MESTGPSPLAFAAGGGHCAGTKRGRARDPWRRKKKRGAGANGAGETGSARAPAGPQHPFLPPSSNDRACVSPPAQDRPREDGGVARVVFAATEQAGLNPGDTELTPGAAHAQHRGASGIPAAGPSRQKQEQKAQGKRNFRSRPSNPPAEGGVPPRQQQPEGGNEDASWSQRCRSALEQLQRTLSQGLRELAEREAALVHREKAFEALQARIAEQERAVTEGAHKVEAQMREARAKAQEAEAMLTEAKAMHARAEQMGLDVSISMAELRRREQQLKDQEEVLRARKGAAAPRHKAAAAAGRSSQGAAGGTTASSAGATGRASSAAPWAGIPLPESGPLSTGAEGSPLHQPEIPSVGHEHTGPMQAAPAPAPGLSEGEKGAGVGQSPAPERGRGSAEGAEQGSPEDTCPEASAQAAAEASHPAAEEARPSGGHPACTCDPWHRSLPDGEEAAGGGGEGGRGRSGGAEAPRPCGQAGNEIPGSEGPCPVKREPDEDSLPALAPWLDLGLGDPSLPLFGSQGPAPGERGEAEGEMQGEEEEETELLRPSSTEPSAPEEPPAEPQGTSTQQTASTAPASGKVRAGTERQQARASRVRQMLLRDAPQLLQELEKCEMLQAAEPLDACLVDLDNDAPALDPEAPAQGATGGPVDGAGGEQRHAEGSSPWKEGALGAHHFSRLRELLSKLGRSREGSASSSGSTGPTAFPLGSYLASGPVFWIHNLVALIQQSAHVQKQGWPVSWGWCASLRSFLFVYHRHNRMILECPEYGKATYFFEIEAGVPVRLQVRRLLAVMGAAAVGRTDVLNDRPLLVGKDLTAADAECLQRFGWSSGMGLGALLNFVERMYHDRKSTPTTTPTAMGPAKGNPTGVVHGSDGASEVSRRGAGAASPAAEGEPGPSRPCASETRPCASESRPVVRPPGSGSESALLDSVHEWKQRIGARLRKGAEMSRCTRLPATSGPQLSKVEMG